jgi:hypothetical protein
LAISQNGVSGLRWIKSLLPKEGPEIGFDQVEVVALLNRNARMARVEMSP